MDLLNTNTWKKQREYGLKGLTGDVAEDVGELVERTRGAPSWSMIEERS